MYMYMYMYMYIIPEIHDAYKYTMFAYVRKSKSLTTATLFQSIRRTLVMDTSQLDVRNQKSTYTCTYVHVRYLLEVVGGEI